MGPIWIYEDNFVDALLKMHVLCEETAAANRGFHQTDHCRFCKMIACTHFAQTVSAMAVSSKPSSCN